MNRALLAENRGSFGSTLPVLISILVCTSANIPKYYAEIITVRTSLLNFRLQNQEKRFRRNKKKDLIYKYLKYMQFIIYKHEDYTGLPTKKVTVKTTENS